MRPRTDQQCQWCQQAMEIALFKPEEQQVFVMCPTCDSGSPVPPPAAPPEGMSPK